MNDMRSNNLTWKKIMKKILFIVFLMLSGSNMYAQYVSVDTIKLNTIYRNLMISNSQENQKAYFKAFPRNWMEYIATYQHYNNSKNKNSQHYLACEQVRAFGKLKVIPYVAYCDKLVKLTVGAKIDLKTSKCLQILLQEKMKTMSGSIFNTLAWLHRGHQFEFWAFYWASSYLGKDTIIELERLQKLHKEKHPLEVLTMVDAYKYFSGKVNPVSSGYLESTKE